MADEQTKTREQELMEDFNAGLDPAGATTLQLRIDALIAENKKLDDEIGQNEQERIDLEAQADKLHKEVDAANARADALQADLEAANARVAKAETAATNAKAKVTRGETSTKPRKLAAMDDGLSGRDLTETLRLADADGRKVEIVASDGTREVAGIPPIAVTGDVWRPHALGHMLKEAIMVEGPHTGGTPFVIDGFALLIGGKQVAYCKRPDVVQVPAGQTVNFADDIYF